jgi:hypothetical protein
MKLVQVFGKRIEVQLCTISPEFGFAMNASKLQYASMLHDFLWFFLQTCSKMLPDDELVKKSGLCLKNLKEKGERKYLVFRSRSENCDCC